MVKYKQVITNQQVDAVCNEESTKGWSLVSVCPTLNGRDYLLIFKNDEVL